jgi:hypothetical protein
MWTQIRGFNQATATKIKNLCLGNVQSGFGIAGKYPTAWDAWLNTQQHTDPIPTGVDVPVFFSYSASIDGINKNWGHIGVRLKDGTFWSDGVIYPSIQAYTANHLPKYVGWGESVNNVVVIKGGNLEEIKILQGIAEARRKLLGRVVSAAGVDTGKIEPDNAVDQAIANIDAKNKQINELKAQLANSDEANILGRALIPVLKALGYKK